MSIELYALSSLMWSVAGVFAGFKYGQLYRDTLGIRRRLNMTDHEVPEPVDPAPKSTRFAVHRPTGQQITGVIVIIMAVITVATGAAYNRRLNTLNECQSDYFGAYTDALQARDQISAQSRSDLRNYVTSENELWLGLLKNAAIPPAHETPDQRAENLATLNKYFDKSRTYIASLDAVNKARQVYPIPDNRCGPDHGQ